MTTIPVTTTNIQDGQPLLSAPVRQALTDLKTGVEQAIDGGYPFLKTVYLASTTVTVSAGVLMVTQSRHKVQNEGALPTDEINTITGTFDVLLLQLAGSGQTTTFKHNTGNLWFEDGRDFILSDQNRVAVFVRNATTGKYTSVNRNTGNLWLTDSIDATISGGSITPTQTKQRLLPETGTADDLATIINSAGLDMVVLSVKTVGHTITVKHNTGNIYFDNGLALVMSDQNQMLVLFWNDWVGRWAAITSFTAAQLQFTDYIGGSGAFNQLELPPKIHTDQGNGLVRLDVLPRFIRRRMFWDEVSVGTTFTPFGMSLTTSGTPSALTEAETAYIRMTSTASIGQYAARRSSGSIFQYRWSPSMEAYVQGVTSGAALDNEPFFVGFLTGSPVVSAGPSINYAGVSGIWIKPYQSGGTTYAGQVYSAGSKLGQVLFGAVAPGADFTLFRIWVDAAANEVVFEVNGERSDPLSVTPGALSTTGIDLIAARATAAASSVILDYSRMYGEQD